MHEFCWRSKWKAGKVSDSLCVYAQSEYTSCPMDLSCLGYWERVMETGKREIMGMALIDAGKERNKLFSPSKTFFKKNSYE